MCNVVQPSVVYGGPRFVKRTCADGGSLQRDYTMKLSGPTVMLLTLSVYRP